MSPGSIRPSRATAPLRTNNNKIHYTINFIRRFLRNVPFHDRTDVDASIAALVTLANDGNAQKIDRVHIERDGDNIQ